MIGRTLAVWAVLIAAAGIAGWVLTGYADRIAHRADERKAGKGSAPAPGSPVPHVGLSRGTQTMTTQMAAHYIPPSMSLRPASPLCGGLGPVGMRCDLPPHTDGRHEFEACGWYESGRPYG